MGVMNYLEQIDARQSAAAPVYLPLCFLAVDPSYLSAAELLQKISACLLLL